MINIDFLTLKAFFTENIDFFIGSRLQKIQQPTRRDFILALRNNGESRKLYINIHPQMYHIAFMSKDNEEKRNLIIPKKPPMFCMLLRKYLEGSKISDAKVVDNERILELHFETYDELSQKRLLCLTVELMGKHSNIILYDKETSIIIGCAHNVGSEKSRYRELQGGLKYIYPPGIYPPVIYPHIKLSHELEKQFKDLANEKIDEYLNTSIFRPAILNDRYTLFSELIENSVPQTSVNQMIDNYYADVQEKELIKTEKNKLTEIVNSKLKKVKNSISKINTLLKKRDNTDKYKLYGELLTANLYQKCDYQKKIEVFDYINNQNIIIELDENKTLSENAQRYYKLYTKSKITKEKSNEMLSSLSVEKIYLENILYSIDCAVRFADFEDIKSELGVNEGVGVNEKVRVNGRDGVNKRVSEKQKKTIVEKIQVAGFDVYIGKNNKQNDYIVSKLAKDEDYWFHTRLCAGSHVLLKVNEQEPDEGIIFECCKIARKYSSASQPSKVGVIYTKAKNLKKPPASPLGYVTYKNEKEVLV